MELRKAVVEDVDAMYALIDHYAQKGLLLPRSRLSLYESLQCFTVAVEGQRLLGVAGLHILWADLAEIRSLAVAPDARGQGIGGRLVNRLSEEAQHLGIPQILALTYQRRFFEKCGFYPAEKQTLPHKVWRDCINCSKFATCDEAAYLRVVTPDVTPRLQVSPAIQLTQP